MKAKKHYRFLLAGLIICTVFPMFSGAEVSPKIAGLLAKLETVEEGREKVDILKDLWAVKWNGISLFDRAEPVGRWFARHIRIEPHDPVACLIVPGQ